MLERYDSKQNKFRNTKIEKKQMWKHMPFEQKQKYWLLAINEIKLILGMPITDELSNEALT
jgi:hypothetical protein